MAEYAQRRLVFTIWCVSFRAETRIQRAESEFGAPIHPALWIALQCALDFGPSRLKGAQETWQSMLKWQPLLVEWVAQ